MIFDPGMCRNLYGDHDLFEIATRLVLKLIFEEWADRWRKRIQITGRKSNQHVLSRKFRNRISWLAPFRRPNNRLFYLGRCILELLDHWRSVG